MKKMIVIALLWLGAMAAIFNGIEVMFLNTWNMVASFVVSAVLLFAMFRVVKSAGGWKKMMDSIPDKELGGKNPCYKK